MLLCFTRQNIKKLHHLAFRLHVIKELYTAHRKALESPHPEKPSNNQHLTD
jgi:hypothetical protein